MQIYFPLFFISFLLLLLYDVVCSGSGRGRWYKFNDNVVEEFDMNDETLEYECFGGEYRPKVYDQCKELVLVFLVVSQWVLMRAT